MEKIYYLLGQLQDSDVDWILDNSQRKSVPISEGLIKSKQPVTSLFIVVDGQFAIVSSKVKEITYIGKGEILGEMSFVESIVPTVSVIATNNSVVLEIPFKAIQENMEYDLGFAARMYKAFALFLSVRLRKTTIQFAEAMEDQLEEDELVSKEMQEKFDKLVNA